MLDDAIRYAVLVAGSGSFTAAASHARVTQSAITKRVADLEQRLGYSIFQRTPKGVILTEGGRAFIDRSSRILDDLDDLMQSTRRAQPYAGPLRLGICPGMLEDIAIAPIAKTLARYPSIRLDVSSASFDRMAQSLRNGSVDVVLGVDDAFAEHPDFNREAVGSLRLAFFVRSDHPLIDMEPVSMRALSDFDLVIPTPSPPYCVEINSIFATTTTPPMDRLHVVDFLPTAKKIVAQSDAIGIAPMERVQSAEFQGFVALDVDEPLSVLQLCCATRARWVPFPAVKAFIQACREALPDDASALNRAA